ncbi:hypothetical protein [Paenibacillus sp. P36]|uniref:hypothetical protein n=1 Tax=Paenibacillus sp. P36 TaxID=3342538 RepID=UPI0038B262EB
MSADEISAQVIHLEVCSLKKRAKVGFEATLEELQAAISQKSGDRAVDGELQGTISRFWAEYPPKTLK